MPTWESKPAQGHGPVTPSDVTVFNPPFRTLFIGVAGNVTVRSLDGNLATYACPGSFRLEVSGTQVRATGTTATGIVAQY